VLVGGLERMTHVPRDHTTAALATAADWELEGCYGASFVSLNAKLMALYMDTYRVEAKILPISPSRPITMPCLIPTPSCTNPSTWTPISTHVCWSTR